MRGHHKIAKQISNGPCAILQHNGPVGPGWDIALGINNIDSSKMCKATFRCDMDAARAKEANFYGPHRLSGLCYQLNQAADGGNALGLRFSIKPNGEGGTIISTYGN